MSLLIDQCTRKTDLIAVALCESTVFLPYVLMESKDNKRVNENKDNNEGVKPRALIISTSTERIISKLSELSRVRDRMSDIFSQ